MPFELKNMDILQATDPARIRHEVINVLVKNLRHYHDHPFKLYTGERLSDMVESIRANGVMLPLVVRPVSDNQFDYEILSGHNRLEASKLAGLEYVPCLIKEDLTEDEAYLIVTESNLVQRSFADLSHSERAVVLATHYDAIKAQGKRTDLVKELENALKNIGFAAEKPREINKNSTSTPVAKKLSAGESIGEKYGLSKDTIARYLRINKLISNFQTLIDENALSIRAGVSLSYLTDVEQRQLFDFITGSDIKINIANAEKLRQLHDSGKFTQSNIEKIFQGKKTGGKPNTKKVLQFKRKNFDTFFTENETAEAIEQTIMDALAFYYSHKDRFSEQGVDESSPIRNGN